MTTQERGSLAKIYDEVQYYPHQIEGIRLMARMGSFLLADEMGLGKSLQALTVSAIDFEQGYAKRVLIVCPAPLKWNWLEECETHTRFKAMILDGTPRERESQINDFKLMGYDILIINYEQVEKHLAQLNAMRFDIAVYDEAHYLKNKTAKRTEAALRLQTTRRFLLTGSPLLNQVNELWSLLHMITPEEYPDYWRFVNRYCVFGGYKNKAIVGVKNKEELQHRIENVMIRRLKADVLDLPEKQYIRIMVDLLPDQHTLYKQAVDEMQITTGDGSVMELENPLTKYLRLKQICGTTYSFNGEDHSSKMDWAEIALEEKVANGEHVVVFTQFRDVQSCMVERLKKRKIKTFVLHGDVPKEIRQEVIRDWSNSAPAVIVCMLQVAGVGFNMTKARSAIFLDELYVPKLNEQAEDRIHRIGADKTQPIQIYKVVVRKTVEQRIQQILQSKRKLFDSLVDESDWKKALYDALREEELSA